ncbi:hypothetical protein EJP77_16175 [Paenibacillus zeisoli]|uniref:Uncharacterized protein n=1 Tax=Paenibacillus zeisoli TaxID=2496267 RepID=A0A3S1B5Y5_9BACL|nr:hypothetical protein [Paenibacillus zeisoli]RUT28942.1 hypothetical protein EJP77_16175 [Paenibacillus zeisoli]
MLNAILLLIGLLSPLNGPSPTADGRVMNSFAQSESSQVVQASWNPLGTRYERVNEFNTLSDISLSDQTKDVISKKGKPDKVTRDKLTGYTEYHYKDVTVGLYDDQVYYVHLGANAKEMKVNKQWIALQSSSLNRAFGPADYTAEDGDVYTRGYSAIKIYRDAAGAILGIDLFDAAAFD